MRNVSRRHMAATGAPLPEAPATATRAAAGIFLRHPTLLHPPASQSSILAIFRNGRADAACVRSAPALVSFSDLVLRCQRRWSSSERFHHPPAAPTSSSNGSSATTTFPEAAASAAGVALLSRVAASAALKMEKLGQLAAVPAGGVGPRVALGMLLLALPKDIKIDLEAIASSLQSVTAVTAASSTTTPSAAESKARQLQALIHVITTTAPTEAPRSGCVLAVGAKTGGPLLPGACPSTAVVSWITAPKTPAAGGSGSGSGSSNTASPPAAASPLSAATTASATTPASVSSPAPSPASPAVEGAHTAALRDIYSELLPMLPVFPKVEPVQTIYGRCASLTVPVGADTSSAGTRGASGGGGAAPREVPFKAVVRQYGRLADLLRALRPYGVFISSNELQCTRAHVDALDRRGGSGVNDACGDSNDASLLDVAGPPGSSARPTSALSPVPLASVTTALDPPPSAAELRMRAISAQDYLLATASSEWATEDICQFWQVEALDTIPEPPADFTNISISSDAVRSRTAMQTVRDGNSNYSGVFTPQMLVPIIPTYFVPVEVVVAQLPEGYSGEHVESLFMPTGTLEAVTLDGRRFIRLHGGSRSVEMMRSGPGNSSQHANENIPAYAPFRPDPALAEHFVDAMKTNGIRPWRWVPLRALLTEIADPEIVARLPFQRYTALVFFSEMQHLFAFSSDGEGEVCYVDPNTVSLTTDRTPTPTIVNELQGMLQTHRQLALTTIVSQAARDEDQAAREGSAIEGADADMDSSKYGLSPYSRDLLLRYFDGNLSRFFNAHRETFHLDAEQGIVMLQSHRRNLEQKKRSLEEQLEDASGGSRRDRKTARRIRRKLARQRDPDNPLFDSDNLAEELARFMPRNNHISLRTFMRNIPPEIFDLFPAKIMNVFINHPKLFRVFEFRLPGRIHIQRPDLPLPEGHLRLSYTEPEILQLVAGTLQDGRQRTLYDIFGRLPWCARETVRTVYKGLFEVLKNYPQYFLIVFRDSVKMDSRSANVTLVVLPPSTTHDLDSLLEAPSSGGGKAAASRHRGGDASSSQVPLDDDCSADALAEIRASMALAGYKVGTGGNDVGGLEDDDG